MGFLFPIAGILIFIASFFLITTPEPFDHDIDAAFDEHDHAGVGAESSMTAGSKILPRNTEESYIGDKTREAVP